MASQVTVIATDLRRVTIKVSPGTYMVDVLQNACQKLNLSSNKFLLKNNKKTVDLSVPWRQAGLAPGAKLELVVKSGTPSAVSVALQLPPKSDGSQGERMVEKFPSDWTIWKVLRQFESGTISQGRNLNITARGIAQTTGGGPTGSGQLFYESPALNIMGRELTTFLDFQKTLSDLGYNSGSVLIRLTFKRSDKTLAAAMEEVSLYFKEEEEENKAAAAKAEEPSDSSATKTEVVAEDEVMQDFEDRKGEQESTAPEEQPKSAPETAAPTDPSSIDTKQHTEATQSDPPEPRDPLQPLSVFSAPSSGTPSAVRIVETEEDFTPSIYHAQLHQARLQANSHNKRLLSDKELEEQAAAEAAKIAAVESVEIEVRFPDNTRARWRFTPDDTGATLYRAIRMSMADNSLTFKLGLSGGKLIIHDDDSPKASLVRGYKLSGKVLLNLIWDDSVPTSARNQTFLKSSVAQRAQGVVIPKMAEVEEANAAPSAPAPRQHSDVGESISNAAKKLPKWFKMGKK